jgi:tryptophan aminotransferase
LPVGYILLSRCPPTDHAGKPNPDTFPFSKISITVNGPEEKTLVLEGAALSEALQYGPPAGHPGLLKVCVSSRTHVSSRANTRQWFSGLQQAVHGISNSDSWTCCVGNGSQEIIHKAFQVFTDPGDAVMLET